MCAEGMSEIWTIPLNWLYTATTSRGTAATTGWPSSFLWLHCSIFTVVVSLQMEPHVGCIRHILEHLEHSLHVIHFCMLHLILFHELAIFHREAKKRQLPSKSLSLSHFLIQCMILGCNTLNCGELTISPTPTLTTNFTPCPQVWTWRYPKILQHMFFLHVQRRIVSA